jgi:hypothetical protein
LTEANLYLETKDFDIQKISGTSFGKKKMNDDLVLTELSANAKNTVDAEKYYKRVIEINPQYTMLT